MTRLSIDARTSPASCLVRNRRLSERTSRSTTGMRTGPSTRREWPAWVHSELEDIALGWSVQKSVVERFTVPFPSFAFVKSDRDRVVCQHVENDLAIAEARQVGLDG